MRISFGHSQKGFSLIEIMVAIIVCGVLAGMALPRFWTLVERFRSKEGAGALLSIYGSQKRYFQEKATYYQSAHPGDLSGLDVTISALVHFNNPTAYEDTWYNGFTDGSPLAQVVAETQRLNNSYTLAVTSEGEVVCACPASTRICPKLGYTRYITF